MFLHGAAVAILILMTGCATPPKCGIILPPPAARYCDHIKGCPYVLPRKEARQVSGGVRLGGACSIKF